MIGQRLVVRTGGRAALALIAGLSTVASVASCGSSSSSHDAGADLAIGTDGGIDADASMSDGSMSDGGPVDLLPRPVASVLGQPDPVTDLNVELGLYSPGQISYGGGKLVVADAGNDRVLIWNGVPAAPGKAPDLVLGYVTSSIANIPAATSASTMNYPRGVWTDGTKLAVADYGNHRVLIWKTFPTTNGQPADFALGQPADSTNLTSNTANNLGVSGASMSHPAAVLCDGTRLYVADQDNNRVLVWNTFPTDSYAAAFALGQPADTTNLTSNAVNNQGVSGSSMHGPNALAFDGKLYVVDEYNSRVLVWSGFPVSPSPAAFALGQPNDGSNLTANATNNGGVSGSSLYYPGGVTSAGGQLFVADGFNSRVLVWNALPTMPTAADFALGQTNLTTSGGSFGPNGLFVVAGQLLVSDPPHSRVLVYGSTTSNVGPSYAIGDPVGPMNLSACCQERGVGPTASSQQGTVATFNDGTRQFAVDPGNSRVLVWNTIPATDGQPADFALGQPAGAGNLTSSGVGSTGGGLYFPQGGWVQGNMLFVADTNNNRVLVWKSIPTGPQLADFALGQPAGPNNLTTTVPSSGGGGTMDLPFSVSSDGTRLFVVDTNNSRVLVWNTIPTTAVAADFALGQPAGAANLYDATPNNGGISGSTMNYPQAVFAMGNALYVSDTSNQRVLVWSPIPTMPVAAGFALGQSDFASSAAATTQTGMKMPWGIHGDGTRLYVADTSNSRILVWSAPPTSMGQPADSVIGQVDFTHGGANPAPMLGLTTFNYPSSIFADGKRLWVADSYNNRVVVIPQ
jgi:hypothetical protein